MCKMSKRVQGSTAIVSISHDQAAKTYRMASNFEFFIRECEVYARLGKHPHVADLLNVQHQTIYLETGRCLREILQGNNITVEQKINWITGLASGLEYIHSKDVVHADLNAANIIIRRGPANKDCSKWIDFGASAIDDREALASYDEYSYKPPEHPKPATSIETDIFAFGCTIFEIETGAPPFYDETKHMSFDERLSYIEERYQKGRYPSIEKLSFKSIIIGCWQGRYKSMTELVEELTSTDFRQPQASHLSYACYGIAAVRKMVQEILSKVWILIISLWLPSAR